MVTIMKKTVKALSIILSLFMIMSLAACSAAPGGYAPEGGMDNGYFDGDMNNGAAGAPGYTGNENMPSDPDSSKPSDGMDNENGTVAPAEGEEGSVEGESEKNDSPGETGGDGVNSQQKVDLITAPFISTQENKFSTFSADVDTASYTYFRKLASSGKYTLEALQNSGSAFRTEEFINYFRYDVPDAREGELFGIYAEIVPCPWNEGSVIFRLTLEAPEAPESAGNNLVFLIDVSGSMSSADKLPLLKKAFSYLVGNLTPKDRVSIVTYSGKEAVVLDGCNGADGDAIMEAINSLKASGSTNGQAGLNMAYQIAEKHLIEGGNNRIIMASDGDLNVGISSAEELTKFIEEKRDQGVYLSVLGFGTGNYKDEKMEALADNGNGVYYYIDGESEAEKVFGTDLSGTLCTVAKDVKLQIEFNDNTVESYRLIGYENRVLDKEDFENDQKDAGEVGAGHQVTVCYEIKLAQGADTDAEYMTFRVRYKNPDEEISRLNEYTFGNETVLAEATEETAFILSVVKTVALLKNKEYNGDITIGSIAAELSEIELSDSYKAEFFDIVQSLAK